MQPFDPPDDEAFHRLAGERWTEILETGETVSWEDAKAWLQACARGEHPPHPNARKPPLTPPAN